MKRNKTNRFLSEREYMDKFYPCKIRRVIVTLMVLSGVLS